VKAYTKLGLARTDVVRLGIEFEIQLAVEHVLAIVKLTVEVS
jgi:hypothetical protein